MPRNTTRMQYYQIGLPQGDPAITHLAEEAGTLGMTANEYIRALVLARDRKVYGGPDLRQPVVWFPGDYQLTSTQAPRLGETTALASPSSSESEVELNAAVAQSNAAAAGSAWDDF